MKCGRSTAFLHCMVLLAGFLARQVTGTTSTPQALGPCTGGTIFNLAATVDYYYILSDNFIGERTSNMVLSEAEMRSAFGSSYNFGQAKNTFASDCKFVITAPADYYVKLEILVLGGARSRRGGCTDYLAITGTDKFTADKICATYYFRDSRSFVPGGDVTGDLSTGNDDYSACSSTQNTAVEITATYRDRTNNDANYAGYILAYRAVKGRNCGLCDDLNDNTCIFNTMGAANFYSEAPEQCSDEIGDGTQPRCYTDITTETLGVCDTTNENCALTCITSPRGDSCIFPFTVNGVESNGCIDEKSVVEGSQSTVKVCPTWQEGDTYTIFQECQDTGTLCPVDSCFSSPCQNGGVCTNNDQVPQGYECECPDEWLGYDCNVRNECKDNYCNGAENNCAPVDNGDGSFSFQCTCLNGNSGDRCEIESKCAEDSNPCNGRGLCTLDPGTPLGYTCDCESPYLGDTCDVTDLCVASNPCKNDALCFTKVDGSALCECVNSWVGDNCAQHPDITLECGASSMAVAASVDVINDLAHGSEEIHLIDETCRLTNNGTHYVTEITYQTCGTIISLESAADVTFFQEIRASKGDGFQSSGFSAALVCQVRASSSVDVGYSKLEHGKLETTYKVDIFPLSINAYTNSATSGTPTPASAPLELVTNEPVYMSVSTSATHQDTQLILQECWCTKEADPTAVQKYILYEQKCPVDSTFKRTLETTREVFFEFLSFRFAGEDYNSVVYIHCSAFLCDVNQSDCTNEASQPCQSGNDGSSRRRREASSEPTSKSRSLTSSFGPIVTGNKQLSGSFYEIVRDDPNTKSGSGVTFQSNLDSALKVYRYYLSENFLYILVIMALIALVLAVITPNINQPQRILAYARYFMTV